jgi:hypothetical protein
MCRDRDCARRRARFCRFVDYPYTKPKPGQPERQYKAGRTRADNKHVVPDHSKIQSSLGNTTMLSTLEPVKTSPKSLARSPPEQDGILQAEDEFCWHHPRVAGPGCPVSDPGGCDLER